MTATSDFRNEQRGVAIGMAGAAAVTILSLGLVAWAVPSHPAPFLERLQAMLRADILVIAWLAAAIANVARLRFFSEQDIAGSGAGSGSDGVRTASAILQNTLEQVCLAIGAHLALTATYDRSIAMIHVLVGLFAAGRLLFWIGYRRGASARAFGFALTFYPSVITMLVAALSGWTG